MNPADRNKTHGNKLYRRLLYLIATLILTGIEFLIALYVHDSFVRPYIGDVLVVIVIYSLVRVVIPDGVKLLPLYIFIFAFFVELLQYLRVVELLGLQDYRFFRVLIGSTFDWQDILCYFVGCVLSGACECLVKRRERRERK